MSYSTVYLIVKIETATLCKHKEYLKSISNKSSYGIGYTNKECTIILCINKIKKEENSSNPLYFLPIDPELSDDTINIITRIISFIKNAINIFEDELLSLETASVNREEEYTDYLFKITKEINIEYDIFNKIKNNEIEWNLNHVKKEIMKKVLRKHRLLDVLDLCFEFV